MKTQTLLIAFTILLNVSFAQPANDAQLTARFDSMLMEQFKANEPGAVVLVARKGEILYHKALGRANLELDVALQPENVFRIGSITKQFTAIAILQLMEQGKLGLQDPVTRFLPGYPNGEKISIEHLLTHTSGLPDYTSIKDTIQRVKSDLTSTEMVNSFKHLPMRFAPGTKWEYSNSGYFLLGYIIEKITGQTYAAYLEKNFFTPLAMTNSRYASDTKLIKDRATGYTHGRNGFENARYISMTQPYAAGAIQSTAGDLFKWQQAVLSYKLVKKENLDKAFTKYKLADGTETAYGYGWRLGNVYENNATWHGGLIDGFMSMAVYLPAKDIYVTVLSNCDCQSLEVVTNKLAALAGGKAYEHKAIAVADKTLQGYTGVYENQKGLQRIITVKDNQLFMQLGRGPRALLGSYQEDRFFYDADAMSTIEFTRNKTGRIAKVTTIHLRGSDVWNKTNKPIPDENGIKLAEPVLAAYVGIYEVSPRFSFSVTREQGRLFLQATGQEKLELFAETGTLFFLKVNDAQLEFVKDGTGKVVKAILKQGGRETEARKTN